MIHANQGSERQLITISKQRHLLLFGGALLMLFLITFLVYRPGLGGPFLLDDFVNLQQLGENGGVTDTQAALSFVFGNRSGPAGRPVSMASFLLNGTDWPVSAAGFKFTNLFLHLICGWLLSWFSLLIFRALRVQENKAYFLALAVAALWLLHPLNVSTTLYVVQRMTQLMTLFSLAALIFYIKGRYLVQQQALKGLIVMSMGLFPFGLLAVLSKENGALLLPAIVALEATVFADSSRTKYHRLWIATAVLLPMLIVLGYIIVNFGQLTASYQFREFSLTERLLTEGRVLVDYLLNVFVPISSDFGLHRDDFTISPGLFNPISTGFSWLFIIVLASVAVVQRRHQRVFSFAVFWFLGWHLLESTFLPLELYFEHRNYLAMAGPLLAAVYYLDLLVERAGTESLRTITKVAVSLLLAVVSLMTLQLTILWGNSFLLQAHWAERHPASYRAQVEYAYLLADSGYSEQGYEVISAIQQRYPEELAMQLQRWNFACSYGLPAPYPVAEIADDPLQVYYRADLTGEIKTFLENLVAARCDYPGSQELVALMERFSGVSMRNFERSGFHLLYSDLFVHYRQLNPALIQLRNAFDIRPDAQYPIRQAIISASAGNYEDSLVFLQRAREADENRRSFVPSRMAEIEGMVQDINTRLGNN